MTIRAERNDLPPGRRSARVAAALFLAIIGALLSGYMVKAGLAVAVVESQRRNHLLILPAEQRRAVIARAASDQTVATAIAALPISQRVVNAAMVTAVQRHDANPQAGWIAALGAMGWRDTGALQNLIGEAAKREDLASVLNYADALLRRSQIMDEATVIMEQLERLPQYRPLLIDRLQQGPAWRSDYFYRSGEIVDPALLDGRFVTLRTLQARGNPVAREEIAPFLPALVAAGRTNRAFDLWNGQDSRVSRPLNDQNFDLLASDGSAERMSVPFEWTIGTGKGFYVDTFRENDDAQIAIRWDGRGAPLLASQQTTAAPGRYVLRAAGGNASWTDMIAFQFDCPRRVVRFQSIGSRASLAKEFVATVPADCPMPRLSVVGIVQPRPRPIDLALSSIALQARR